MQLLTYTPRRGHRFIASICTLLSATPSILLWAKPTPSINALQTGTPTREALRETCGWRYIFVRADLTKAEDVERAVATCVKEFGRLDVVVNAGISVEAPRIHETAEDDYDKTMVVNAKGVFLGCKYAIRQMLQQEPLPWSNGDGRQAHKAWLDILGPVSPTLHFLLLNLFAWILVLIYEFYIQHTLAN